MRAFTVFLIAVSAALAQGGAGAGVYPVGGGVSAPSLVSKVEPQYSEEARNVRYQGTVRLYVEVNPDGEATNIKVERSLGLGLDEKAIEAVRKWRFKPGMKDGKPVTVMATIEVNFRLLNTGWNTLQQYWFGGPGVTVPAMRATAFPPDCKAAISARVSLDVASDGSVSAVRVIRTDDPSANDAVIAAVQRWNFEPARRQNSALPVSGEIELACAPR
jgi:TonB family protein